MAGERSVQVPGASGTSEETTASRKSNQQEFPAELGFGAATVNVMRCCPALKPLASLRRVAIATSSSRYRSSCGCATPSTETENCPALFAREVPSQRSCVAPHQYRIVAESPTFSATCAKPFENQPTEVLCQEVPA